MHITVIGCGRWGSLIAWYLDRTGHRVTLYGRPGSRHMQRFLATRQNDLLTLPESIALSTDLACVRQAETVVISIGSQGLQGLMDQLKPLSLRDRIFVLCMKGLEQGTGRRLSQIAQENLDPSNAVAVWLGPGHVQEFYRGIPNCMVIDSEDDAVKNVVGIAAGFLDGKGLSSLKGALMSRGTREVARLIQAMGGSQLSAYGLCHLGDYEATVFSRYSHNRQFGESFIRGETYTDLAEGYYTVEALVLLGQRYGVELPICQAVHRVLYCGADPMQELRALLDRNLTREFGE